MNNTELLAFAASLLTHSDQLITMGIEIANVAKNIKANVTDTDVEIEKLQSQNLNDSVNAAIQHRKEREQQHI